VPATLRFAIASITTMPNPRRPGTATGGPSRSIQLTVMVSPSGDPANIDTIRFRRARRVFAGDHGA